MKKKQGFLPECPDCQKERSAKKRLTPRERAERLQAWLVQKPESALDEDFVIHAEAEIRSALRVARAEHNRFIRQCDVAITRIEKKLQKLDAHVTAAAQRALREQSPKGKGARRAH